MAVETTGTTGRNTSADRQISMKVQEGGCITPALKAALESQVKLELAASTASSGTINVLSSTAVNQIVSQLLVDQGFNDLLIEALNSDEVLNTIIPALLATEDFGEAVDNRFDTKLADEETTSTISTNLLASEDFLTGIKDYLLADEEVTQALENAVVNKLNELDLFVCSQATYEVIAGKVVKVPISGMNSNDYWFDYNVVAYDNAGGGTDTNGSSINDRTPTQTTIVFPNTQPGDKITLHHVRIDCSEVS